ncbi:MAG: PAS domain S-box protein [Chloroflexota bacterium]
MAIADASRVQHQAMETGALAQSERLQPLLATLVAATRAVVGAETRDALLRSVVEVLAGHGAFAMAFTAADLDGDGWLEPIHCAGTGMDYVSGIRIAVADIPEGRGPAGTAIRSGHPVICTDIETDPMMAPWRDRALGYGLRSTASFPMRSRSLPTGVLSVYAPVAGAFGLEEAALMEDLAVTVGYAVDALEDRSERAAAEARGRESDAHLRGALDALTDAVSVLSPVRENGEIVDERIEYTNAAWRAVILGDPDAPDPIGKRLLEAFPSFADRLPHHRRVLETGEPFRAIMAAPRPDGDGWYDTEYVRYGDGVVAISRDVTAGHSAQAARAEADARFRQAMDHAPIGMCIATPDGSLLEVNAAMCEMLGRDQETLLGLHWRDFTHPEDVATDLANQVEVLAGRSNGYRILKRYLRADGGIVWADLSVGAVRDAGGDLLCLVGQLIDVTDQLAHEQSLRQSEERYRELVDELDAIVFVHDVPSGQRFVSANSEAITGYPVEQLIDPQFWREIVVNEDRERISNAWDDDSPTVTDLHYRLRRADGRVISVEERWRATSGPDGRPARWFAVTWDVTSRRQLEETVARTGRLEAVSRVTAAAAHDFGNVLMGIRIFHGYLSMATPPDDPRAEDIRAIGQAVERGTALTHQLLQIGREASDQAYAVAHGWSWRDAALRLLEVLAPMPAA